MKTTSTLTLIAVAGLMLGAACTSKKAEEKVVPQRLNVVCTFLPVYVITQNVVKDIPGVSVHNLLPPNVGCPHNYSMTPGDAAVLEKADVLVMNGLGMEEFLKNSSYLEREGLQAIDASRTVEPILIDFSGGDDLHAPPESDRWVNPHAWVSPFEAAKMARQIGKRLAEIDSAFGGKYARNAENYAARLDALGQKLVGFVSRGSNPRIVVFHNAFDYLARDVGLEVIAVIQSEDGVEPSAKELAELIDKINREKPAAIFSEPQYSDRLARMLSDETGVPLYTMDPAVTGSDDPLSYFKIMVQNLKTLRRALEVGPPR